MTSQKFQLFPKDLQYLPYLWLFYMAFPLYYLFKFDLPLSKLLICLALLALFLYLYRAVFWSRGRRTVILCTLEVIITAILGAYVDPQFLALSYYPIAPIGYLPRNRMILAACSGMLLVYTGAISLTHEITWEFFTSSGLIPVYLSIFVFPYGVRLFMKWKLTNTQLVQARQDIERLTKEAERQRIARDLHDTLGHTLSMITLKSELAEKLSGRDPERAAQEMRDVQNASRNALRQVRELVSNMHSVSLAEELEHARELLGAAKISFQVWGEVCDLSINAYANTVLAMCLREAVTNVVKHSGAGQCVAELVQTATATELRVSDDGIGVQVGFGDRSEAIGSGLLGMSQRLELVGGELRVESKPPRGTSVIVRIPRIVTGQEEERTG